MVSDSRPVTHLHHARVMVIDDQMDTIDLIRSLLISEVGVAYCGARPSGAAFFSWLRTSGLVRAQPHIGNLDLILLDILLAHEDGFTLLPQLRALPELHRTRIVALSSSTDSAVIQRVRLAGFDGLLGKPIAIQPFPNQIRRLLNGEMVCDIPC